MMRRVTSAMLALVTIAAAPQPRAPQRIVDRVAAIVRKTMPTATIVLTDSHGFTIKLPRQSDYQVSVRRIEDFCSVNTAADCDDQVKVFAESSVALATTDFTVTKQRLRVIVRNREDTDGYRATVREIAKQPLTRPLASGVSAVLAADFPKGTRMVSAEDLGDLGLTADAAFALGIAQVLADLPPPPKPAEIDGKLIFVSGFDYGASMLLSPERWRALNNATEGRLFIAIPSDNEVVIGTIKPGDDVAKLREFISQDHATAARGISPLIYHWSQGYWVPLN